MSQLRSGRSPLRAVHKAQARRERLAWLEDEISAVFSINCCSIKTGTSLRNALGGSPRDQQIISARRDEPLHTPASGTQASSVDAASASVDNPGLSLLALNATGEPRYLGPSSGSFIANYIALLARSLGPNQARCRPPPPNSNNGDGREGAMTVADVHKALSPDLARFLARSFQLWMLPLYPLFSNEDLDRLVTRCSDYETSSQKKTFEQNCDMIIYFLVMALGATNAPHTLKETKEPSQLDSSMPSASHLYGAALNLFEHSIQHHRPSVFLIQTLVLISMYSSYGPSGLSQWQLSGLAMRMAVELGLHCSYSGSQISDLDIDRRNRVFWASFIIEITLAYNLGRPPSITDDYITAKLPEGLGETAFGVQHIKHRRIQNRIMASVYCTNPSKTISMEDRLQVIESLQTELDGWRDFLAGLYEHDKTSVYPHSYWERLYYSTSFVLHRSSPLCPQPSPKSAEFCIRSAGHYIDNLLGVLRSTNVPITWMLVQGVIFAGLTILVTARTTASKLAQYAGPSFLLVDLANWTRKCSLCITIINERWSEDLVASLDAQYETLAIDTLKIFATGLIGNVSSTTATSTTSPGLASNLDSVPNTCGTCDAPAWSAGGDAPAWSAGGDAPLEPSPPMEWRSFEPFRDFLGWDNGQAFWNIFPAQSGFGIFDALGAAAGQEAYMTDQYGSQEWTNMFLGL
ncbi:unnamed protein product [Clonostachys rhizophaga]|uniref:Xylanolytic transcriptional activator regulatory domain-containing protein n=1 Tax=Clonostachys rhizophaga TaxID=160324 RepID=A0A9N9VYR4_9HYPO|nr:unnamed protein product [Clonostachys rhizophaga]